MARQIVIRTSPVASIRRKLLLAGNLTPEGTPPPPPRVIRRSSNVGEVAGGATAECCAICCCCPCVLLEFVLLVVYKVPASVCRLILKKRRKKKLIKRKSGLRYSGYYDEFSDVDLGEFEGIKVSIDGSEEAIELDQRMWEQFHEAGFWRSQSQRVVLD